MINMFNRKPAGMLDNGAAEKHVCTPPKIQEAELIGYYDDRGLLGQPSSFYVGISFGIVFHAALATIFFCLVTP